VGAATILLGLAGLGGRFLIGRRIRTARRARRVATTWDFADRGRRV